MIVSASTIDPQTDAPRPLNPSLARMILINRISSANENCEELYRGIQDTFGHAIHAINLPSGGGDSVIDVLEVEEGETDFPTRAALTRN
jgi:hypothetical protein